MAPILGLSHLSNPLATPAQLATSASQLDGVPADLEDSVRYASSRLIQVVGILLRLPQEIIAETIVIFARFWLGPDGGSLVEYSALDVVAASLYVVAKPSAHPITPRQLLTAVECASQTDPIALAAATNDQGPQNFFLSEGAYQTGRIKLMQVEEQILRVVGYQTHVALPYTLCINYLQTLDMVGSPAAQALAQRAFAQLNAALLSPQLLYLTHQPCALATAAIYYAAKVVQMKLPEDEWWEVFDVDREELGFLVVAMTSMDGFAKEEARKWSRRKAPLTIEDVRAEMERRHLMESGE